VDENKAHETLETAALMSISTGWWWLVLTGAG